MGRNIVEVKAKANDPDDGNTGCLRWKVNVVYRPGVLPWIESLSDKRLFST